MRMQDDGPLHQEESQNSHSDPWILICSEAQLPEENYMKQLGFGYLYLGEQDQNAKKKKTVGGHALWGDR